MADDDPIVEADQAYTIASATTIQADLTVIFFFALFL